MCWSSKLGLRSRASSSKDNANGPKNVPGKQRRRQKRLHDDSGGTTVPLATTRQLLCGSEDTRCPRPAGAREDGSSTVTSAPREDGLRLHKLLDPALRAFRSNSSFQLCNFSFRRELVRVLEGRVLVHRGAAASDRRELVVLPICMETVPPQRFGLAWASSTPSTRRLRRRAVGRGLGAPFLFHDVGPLLLM